MMFSFLKHFFLTHEVLFLTTESELFSKHFNLMRVSSVAWAGSKR